MLCLAVASCFLFFVFLWGGRTKRTQSSHFPLVFSLPPLLGTISEGKKAHVMTRCRGIKDPMDGKVPPHLSVIYLVHS